GAGAGTEAGGQYYLLRGEGLVPVTATGAALLLGDPDIRAKAYAGASPAALPVGADVLKDHQAPGSTGVDPSASGLPDAPPRALRVPA
ncbi:type VII secretion protein EccB, partial [Streptomyces scabiei]